MTPFDTLLCERSPDHAQDWEDGFISASQWAKVEDPALVQAIYEAVKLGRTDAWVSLGLPYDAWHEGLVHGIYGLKEYQRLVKP